MPSKLVGTLCWYMNKWNHSFYLSGATNLDPFLRLLTHIAYIDTTTICRIQYFHYTDVAFWKLLHLFWIMPIQTNYFSNMLFFSNSLLTLLKGMLTEFTIKKGKISIWIWKSWIFHWLLTLLMQKAITAKVSIL